MPTGLPGRLRAGELLMFAILPFAYTWLSKSAQYYNARVQLLIGCLVGLFIWHGIADLIQGTPTAKVIDVSATLAFTGMKLYILAALFLQAPSTVVPVLVGISIGEYFFAEKFQLNRQMMEAEYWDIKIAPWAGSLLIAFVLATRNRFRLIVVVAILLYGVAAGYYGARSHGLTMIVAVGIPYFISLAMKMGLTNNKRSVFKLVVSCIAILIVMTVVYVEAARAGFLTHKSRTQILSIKNPYNPIELIWSGRAGTLIGIMGAWERPVFGYGSMQFKSRELSSFHGGDQWSVIHSMVVESMVYGGLITLVFWVAFGHLVLQFYPPTSANIFQVSHYNILASVAIISLAWGLLFSPLVSARFVIPFNVAVMIHCHQMTRRNFSGQLAGQTKNAMLQT